MTGAVNGIDTAVGDVRRKLSRLGFTDSLAPIACSPANASLVRTKVINTNPNNPLSRLLLQCAASSGGAWVDWRNSGMADGAFIAVYRVCRASTKRAAPSCDIRHRSLPHA